MTEDLRHFPRTEFAEDVYNRLVSGATQGVRLFGTRRTGKTQFLIKDLIPLAKNKGHRVVYVDFWQMPNLQLDNMFSGFERALQPRTTLEYIMQAIRHFAGRLKLQVPFGEIEVDFSNLRSKHPKDLQLLLDECCEILARDRKISFLVFDEFQELAKAENAKPLIGILRRAFDKHRGKLAAVFVGSSQAELERMFSQREAPFFRFSERIHLPPLGEDFVDHQLKTLFDLKKIKFDRGMALGVFKRYDCNPFFLRRFLEEIPRLPHKPTNEIVQDAQDILADDLGFINQFCGLTRNQKILLFMLAMPESKDDERIIDLTKDNPISNSALATARDELDELGIIEELDGEWIIADPLFKSWLNGKPIEDIRASL